MERSGTADHLVLPVPLKSTENQKSGTVVPHCGLFNSYEESPGMSL